MHLGSSEVLTTLKMFMKNMLTHVHKVIHLVVGTFDQGRSGGALKGEETVGIRPASASSYVSLTGRSLPASGAFRSNVRSVDRRQHLHD